MDVQVDLELLQGYSGESEDTWDTRVLLRGCSGGVLEILQECSRDAQEVLQGCSMDFPGTFPGCSGDPQGMLQGCSGDAPGILRRCSEDAPGMLQRCSGVAPFLCLVSLDPPSCSQDVEQIPNTTSSCLEKVLAAPGRNFTFLTPAVNPGLSWGFGHRLPSAGSTGKIRELNWIKTFSVPMEGIHGVRNQTFLVEGVRDWETPWSRNKESNIPWVWNEGLGAGNKDQTFPVNGMRDWNNPWRRNKESNIPCTWNEGSGSSLE